MSHYQTGKQSNRTHDERRDIYASLSNEEECGRSRQTWHLERDILTATRVLSRVMIERKRSDFS